MSKLPQPTPPPAMYGLFVCLAVVVALGGCSSSMRIAMDDRPAPQPRPAVRPAQQPLPSMKSSLGRPADPPPQQYAWNGSPDRISEGHGPASRPVIASTPAYPASAALAPPPVHLPRGSVLVQPGDTLYGLSRRHGVSISALMDLNQLKTLTLQPGQVLKLPATARSRG